MKEFGLFQKDKKPNNLTQKLHLIISLGTNLVNIFTLKTSDNCHVQVFSGQEFR